MAENISAADSVKTERQRELTTLLSEASKAYYQQDREIMSNQEYDKLYDELEALEKETGIVFSGSVTNSVGYESSDALVRERHEEPMLSLDKTKDIEVLRAFVGDQRTLISWKLDGLTVVLTYRGGELEKAVTRGNGEVGEIVTSNAKTFVNLPLTIPFKGELILRGEAVISYSDFTRINEQIEDVDARYKNPRNLCSGSVRQLDSAVTAARSVRFYAFSLVRCEGGEVDFKNSHELQFKWLAGQGFEVVEYRAADAAGLDAVIGYFAGKIKDYDIPSDGLVALYDDIAYGRSLGRTAKFPRNAFAFKWKDETALTTLEDIEWSASRTGLINPVAIFEPVELEGTTVTRASVHNVSIVESLQLGRGDRISVYKANMIIPQIAENLTRSGTAVIPEYCPVCGSKTIIRQVADVRTLYCPNENCLAKHIKSLSLFVSRDALNIEGLSEATLEKLVDSGIIHGVLDLFRLDAHKQEITSLEGFGEKSYANLLEQVEKSRDTTLPRVLYSLGIEGVGISTARLICDYFDHDMNRIQNADEEALQQIEGVGPVLASSVSEWFSKEENRTLLDELLPQLHVSVPQREEGQDVLAGKVFVITGSVSHYANRNELKAVIEKLGGKVTGSVSAKTDYLINNDSTSSSTKNRKAAQLGIPVITEEEFVRLFDQD